ncbi:MAG: hypothetical protein KC925_01585 [Candidatus Doudnabacteria bacterium]|nr:hypothetical protein [Candidatus Doudnabacteria bacterium]
MALVPISKIRILVLRSKVQELVRTLQRKGVIELREVIDCEGCEHELHEGEETQLAYTQAEVEFALRFLAPYDNRKVSLAEKAKTGGKLLLTDQDIEQMLSEVEVSSLIAAIEKLEVEQQRIRARREQIAAETERLLPWAELPGVLTDYTSRSAVTSRTILIPFSKADAVAAQLNAREDASLTRLLPVGGIGKEAWQFFVKSEVPTGDIDTLLNEAGAETVQLPEQQSTISELLQKMEDELKTLESEEAQLEERIQDQVQYVDVLRVAYDQATWRAEEFEALDRAAATERVAVLEGFVRERDVESLKEFTEKMFAPAVLDTLELAEGEEPPVTIENNALFAPFEAVTRIYGLPKNGEPDPTPYLSPFFAVYFALCLTDAAYGMILFVLTFLVQKFVRLGDEAKKLVRLIMIGGLFTSVIGIFFGGWFGIELSALPKGLQDVTLINPLEDVMTFLGIAAALGFVQLIAALIINMVWRFTHGDKGPEAWGSLAWVLALLTGAAHVGLPYVIDTDISGITLPVLYVFLFFVMFFSGKDLLASKKEKMSKGLYIVLSILLAPIRAIAGVMGLYGIIGYVSDILSYSRLLALGLSTGIVALAINIIAALVRDMVPGVGIVLAIIVLVGGHAFNIVNNVLGAYIHSGRLQFVEFFPKFLEGGGEEWKPLVRKGTYVDVVEA